MQVYPPTSPHLGVHLEELSFLCRAVGRPSSCWAFGQAAARILGVTHEGSDMLVALRQGLWGMHDAAKQPMHGIRIHLPPDTTS